MLQIFTIFIRIKDPYLDNKYDLLDHNENLQELKRIAASIAAVNYDALFEAESVLTGNQCVLVRRKG